MNKVNNNIPNWNFRREITVGSILHILTIIITVSAVWCNLQNELVLIKHDLNRLIQSNARFHENVTSLNKQSYNHEYRITALEQEQSKNTLKRNSTNVY